MANEGKRQKEGLGYIMVSLLEIVYPIFAAWAVITAFLPSLQYLPLLLSMTLILVFLKHPTGGGSERQRRLSIFVDLLLIFFSIVTGLYLFAEYSELVDRIGSPTRWDVLLGTVATLLVLEATRRVSGWTLVIIACAALFYTYFGAGFGIGRITTYLYTSTDGLYGVALNVTVRYIIIFIIFGAVMEAVGGMDFFMKFAQLIAGRWRSGPAQIGVIGSAFMGMVSGSAVANVATVGSFTIPLMKKLGYESEVAGGIEAAASSGGQIMPPVMGAGAFLMADFLGIPYLDVALAAAIPAVLYFLSVAASVYFYAEKSNVKKIDPADLPRLKGVLKGSYYLIPLLCIIVLLIFGYSPVMAGLYATLLAILVGFLKKSNWLNPQKCFSVCKKSSYGISEIAIIAAWAGILIGALGATGLSLQFSSMIVALSRGYLSVCLFLTMLGALFLGMGMPTTVVYIILAVLVAPALTTMGVAPLAAHMFVFFFGTMSMVTPPVAFAAYAASGIAGSDFTRTGWKAFKMVLPSFMVAYVFIYDNSLLFKGEYYLIAYRFFMTLVGVVGIAMAIEGWFVQRMKLYERLSCSIGGILLILPGILFDIAGALCIGLVVFSHIVRSHKRVSIARKIRGGL